MKKSIKSALLSGLVFPGAGHIYLKKYKMAAIFIITTLASIVVIVMEAVKHAKSILQEIEASGIAVNASNIAEMSARAANNADTKATSIATLLIIAETNMVN